MIPVMLIVCRLSAMDICVEQYSGTDAFMTECAVHGQQIGREWVNEHPKWMLKGWRCGRKQEAT